jgi:hypothetical protein
MALRLTVITPLFHCKRGRDLYLKLNKEMLYSTPLCTVVILM